MGVQFGPWDLLFLCAISWLLGLVCAPFIKPKLLSWRRAIGYMVRKTKGAPRKDSAIKYVRESAEDDDGGSEVKLVLCVRTDLEMGKGKIAAQCGHAALGAYLDSVDRKNPYLDAWMSDGQKKVVLKVKSREEMVELRNSAAAAKVQYHTTCDAGRTQIPVGSCTVIAIGPAPEGVVDRITGHLKLL